MDDLSRCIHDILPIELIQKIFFLSAPTLTDLLRISRTCRTWRKLIFNPFIIECYFKFDEKHRRRGLVQWWNFNENIDDPINNPFQLCSLVDCFLGKCAVLPDQNIDLATSSVTEFQFDIDRGQDFSIALWFYLNNLDSNCLLLVSDEDWDYRRSSGFGLDDNGYLSIGFQSTISYRMIPSKLKAESQVWYHVVIVQERAPESETPEQKLWINGELVLTAPVPISGFATRAIFSFSGLIFEHHLMADVSLWSRCLSPIEIQTTYHQKLSIDKIDVAQYIFQHIQS